MDEAITITAEQSNKCSWVKVFIPQVFSIKPFAVIKNSEGNMLKKVFLQEGYNAIDISNITEKTISIKIETSYQTILKHLNINQ